MRKKTAIVLGGTVPHAEFLRLLKKRGYHTVLLDYLENPVARSAADEHIRESTLDKDAVLRVAKEVNADLVISAAVDQANVSACYAMEQLGKYVPYSYETAKNVTNKTYMKRIMLENGIPTSQYFPIDATTQLSGLDIQYPVMVKPADSNSSNGVKKAESFEALQHYAQEAIDLSRTNQAIVEGFMDGQEISAYCLIQNGKAKLLMSAERLSVTEGEQHVIKCYASIAPARISPEAQKNAEMVATAIAQVFGFNNTPLFFQGIVQNNHVKVIEFAPRVGGGLCFSTIRDNTGYDVLEAAIDSYCGHACDLSTYHEPECIYVVNTIYGKNGIFNQLVGMEELLQEGIVEHSFLHKSPGMMLSDLSASKSRIGGFIVKAKDMNEAKRVVAAVYDRIDALNEQGESIIRRDLNISVQL